MKGSDYVAVRRLTNREGEVLAMPGATCERVPESSLSWLLDRGWIKAGEVPAAPERVDVTPAKKKGKE